MMPAAWRGLYSSARTKYWAKPPPTSARRQRYVEVRNRLVKAIADSGGKIWRARTRRSGSTCTAGRCTASWRATWARGSRRTRRSRPPPATPRSSWVRSAEWGTIERGKRADLVLLAANPLERDHQHRADRGGVARRPLAAEDRAGRDDPARERADRRRAAGLLALRLNSSRTQQQPHSTAAANERESTRIQQQEQQAADGRGSFRDHPCSSALIRGCLF